MKRSYVVALGSGLLFLLGCEQRLGDFTFLSSKNMDLSNLQMDAAEGAPIVEGRDAKAIFLWYGTRPSMKEAADRAIESGKGTGLSDATIYAGGWWFIVGEDNYRVKGKVVR